MKLSIALLIICISSGCGRGTPSRATPVGRRNYPDTQLVIRHMNSVATDGLSTSDMKGTQSFSKTRDDGTVAKAQVSYEFKGMTNLVSASAENRKADAYVFSISPTSYAEPMTNIIVQDCGEKLVVFDNSEMMVIIKPKEDGLSNK